MSKMGQFVLEMQEFTQAAAGLSPDEALALSEMFFNDDCERAYAMSQYNPARYANMSYSQIISELSRAGMD